MPTDGGPDIKQSNIMIQIPDEALLLASLEESDENLDTGQKDSSIEENQTISNNEYTIIPSTSLRDIYLSEGFKLLNLSISLADWGVATWSSNHLTPHIQPILRRAP